MRTSILFKTDIFTVNNAANSENILVGAADGAVELYHNGLKKFETTANGVLLADDVKITLGNNDDFSIYHSPNNNYIDADTGTLNIR